MMVDGTLLSANYNPYRTTFEAKGGEWILFSEPAFKGCSVAINPSHGRIRVRFTVKSIKPNSVRTLIQKEFILFFIFQARGIKQYRGEYFVSLTDFSTWMRMAYPELPVQPASYPIFLNEMLWYDMITEIFRPDGGLIRINEEGEVFPDHPFDEEPPCKRICINFSLEFHLNFCVSWTNYFILCC